MSRHNTPATSKRFLLGSAVFLGLTASFFLIGDETQAEKRDAWTAETDDTGLRSVDRKSARSLENPWASGDYILEWQDEFTGNTLDTSKWAYREDNKHQSIQLRENVSTSGGSLRLDLRRLNEPIDGKTASGAGVVSKRRFGYGWYEARARLGNGFGEERGWHHSFWAMATEIEGDNVSSTYPGMRYIGIDCFENPTEHLEKPGINSLNRFEQHIIVWDKDTREGRRLPQPPENQTAIPGFDASEWHTYAFEWTPEKIAFYVDGQLTRTIVYPASKHTHEEINIWLTAISANWNHQGDQIPSKAEYDYFRFYRGVAGQ